MEVAVTGERGRGSGIDAAATRWRPGGDGGAKTHVLLVLAVRALLGLPLQLVAGVERRGGVWRGLPAGTGP